MTPEVGKMYETDIQQVAFVCYRDSQDLFYPYKGAILVGRLNDAPKFRPTSWSESGHAKGVTGFGDLAAEAGATDATRWVTLFMQMNQELSDLQEAVKSKLEALQGIMQQLSPLLVWRNRPDQGASEEGK